ncbi:MAG: A/G-specific adenine glycosylase [Leptospira bouyouniensis]|uniref:Adenine DNA glycosylase n=1 Tax=Leptospira bouyouniensis TaxID=2484911 RepID=A0ABY2L4X2_9LEPT|nr:A/G-specific adenine glycosylase [Leptospira bouyouniensis]TGK47152.1 A/G-specific adenine glycosylase [Leptospira bouyouniensis]TGM80257.1 A/G-specific adenine glycosylase [Leptospira bouyouniensis]
MNPQKKLHDWYLLHKRDLPFRKKKQAYPIWISEVMLQQTRVTAMLPLFEVFLERFPNPESLAKASEEEVLSYWKGLGYYSRARNIRKAAIQLVNQYNGAFPKDLEMVLKLPGIGNYTARAILSIAYDLPFAVLDGNVKRVLSRYFGYTKNILGPQADKELQNKADEFLNIEFPGDHNQAVMELGAIICLPETPKCLVCPLMEGCFARIHGKTKEIPIREKNQKQVDLIGEIWVIEKDQNYLLIKETKNRFLKGMFHLPYGFIGELPNEEYKPSEFQTFIRSEWKENQSIGKFKHTITHHRLEYYVHHVILKDTKKIESVLESFQMDSKWVKRAELESEFPSSLAKKVKKFLLY